MMLLFALVAADVGPATESIQFRTAEALVIDRNGKPLFRTTRDFLLQVSGNPGGTIYAYDSAKRRVRVSEINSWWIPCSELQSQSVACAEPHNRPKRSGSATQDISASDAILQLESRGVPSCPGDPRCPTGN